MKPAGQSRPAGRRNTVQYLQTGGVTSPTSEPTEEDETAPVNPHIELLPFVRLHASHPESKGAPGALAEAQMLEIMELSGRPESNKKFRLAVRGHTLLVLDDTGSRIALTEAELLGLEIVAKAGSEGIPPMIGLKVAQPQDPPVAAVKPPEKAPPASSPASEIHKARKVAPPPDMAWLMVAEGGEECLHRAALTLAGAGALRSDFEAAYHMEDGVVGAGAFGSVHRARAKNSKGEKERSGEPLVVKCVDPDAFHDPSKGPPVREAIPKLLRSEMAFMLTAKGHPHILALHAVFRLPTRQWVLVMDFCAGGDAFAHIAKTGVQTEASCRILIDGLLSALSHLAGLRILHRDVKPENLLLQTGGRPIKRRVGSPGYISPEVLLGSQCSHKADVFAAGGTLHFAMTGSAPFIGKDMATTLHKTMHEEVYYEGVDSVSDQCKKFALLLLSKAAEERPSAQQALRHGWFGRRVEDGVKSVPLPAGRAVSSSGKRKASTVKVDKAALDAMTMGKTMSQKSDGGPPRSATSFRKGRVIPRSADDRMK
eukprot:s3554_g5.t1